MSDDDQLASTLAGIRERLAESVDNEVGGICWSQRDVAPLLAAIDAVLKLHVPIERGRVMRCCEGCEDVNGDWHEDCCHEWPCPTYEEITRELSGTRRTQPGEDGES